MKSILRLAAAGLVVVLFTGSLFFVRSGSSDAPDYQSVSSVQGLEETVVEIPAGATGSEIARAFFRVAVADSRSQKIAPGGHRLTLQISAQQALDQLLDPERIPNLIRITEGAWRREIQKSFLQLGFTSS